MSMRLTHRGWGVVSTGVVLAVLGVVFAQPPLLIGTVAIGAWTLGQQYRFVRALSTTIDDLTVEQAVAREHTVVDRETAATLSVTLSSPAPLDIAVELVPPVSATGSERDERRVHLGRGQTTTSPVVFLEWTVAGSYEFEVPELTITDAAGVFCERLARGPTPTVVVEPRGPHDIHIGQGGKRLMVAYGERQSGRRDAGLDPGELREYVPGDSAGRIDWKATARMNEPYVREYEVETDIVTALFVDHRATMDEGPPKQTKLDYAKQVALVFVDSARTFGDPLGYYSAGDEGITDRRDPATGQYSTIKRRLREVTPTVATTDATTTELDSPAVIRRAATRLTNQSRFETTLRPYFETGDTYVGRIEGDPLFETARTHLARLNGTVWTVIFTDDIHRAELRETVGLARRGGGHVLVFLTPSALFEPGGLADIEDSYERYRAFESFRRELAGLRRVSAFEVGPRDRLDTILSSNRRTRSTEER